jgi:hypothetical protein
MILEGTGGCTVEETEGLKEDIGLKRRQRAVEGTKGHRGDLGA